MSLDICRRLAALTLFVLLCIVFPSQLNTEETMDHLVLSFDLARLSVLPGKNFISSITVGIFEANEVSYLDGRSSLNINIEFDILQCPREGNAE